jgi:hypothetical protein
VSGEPVFVHGRAAFTLGASGYANFKESSDRLMCKPVAPSTVWQTDIIYYGSDLADYLNREFKLGESGPWTDLRRPIRFWDRIVG